VTVAGSPDPPDADLVARARQGEEEAFAELVRRHERPVYNLAYRMLGRAEDARDAAQDAFVSCYRNLRRFRGDAAFATWLHRIAVNACYDILRKRRVEPVELDEGLGEAASGDHADQTSDAVDVQRALARVPAEFRAVMILHDVQGLPYEDIAAALEVPVGTVKSRLHRGRVALGEALGAARRRTDRTKREPAAARAPSKRTTTAKRARKPGVVVNGLMRALEAE
jgi:RNA polymerase sigma-70 factor (ECF subfamily)